MKDECCIGKWCSYWIEDRCTFEVDYVCPYREDRIEYVKTIFKMGGQIDRLEKEKEELEIRLDEARKARWGVHSIASRSFSFDDVIVKPGSGTIICETDNGEIEKGTEIE